MTPFKLQWYHRIDDISNTSCDTLIGKSRICITLNTAVESFRNTAVHIVESTITLSNVYTIQVSAISSGRWYHQCITWSWIRKLRNHIVDTTIAHRVRIIDTTILMLWLRCCSENPGVRIGTIHRESDEVHSGVDNQKCRNTTWNV